MFDEDRVALWTNTFFIFVLLALLFHLKCCKHVAADASAVQSIYTLQYFITSVAERKHEMFKGLMLEEVGFPFSFFFFK